MVNDLMVAGNDFVAMHGTGLFNPRTGARLQRASRAFLRAEAGLLETNLPSRSCWEYQSVDGELLAIGEKGVYGARAFVGQSRKSGQTVPGGAGYTLFGSADGREDAWAVRVPLRMTALVLAGTRVFAAGPPDVEAAAPDPWAAFDGKLGGELWAFAAADGKKLNALKLGAPPVFDGMAAARGRLYLSTADGKVSCFGGQ
jgi:hypothetical protein